MPASNWIWYELMTSDPDAAREFYAKVVGFTFEPWPDPAMAGYTIVKTTAGVGMGGLMKLPDEAAAGGVPPNWGGVVGVADCDAAVAQAVELGGKVLAGPFDIPNVGRYAALADPAGAAFGVMAMASTGEAGPLPEGPGSVCWRELWTTQPDTALGYYGALFGWSESGSMDMGPEGLYRMYKAEGEQALGGVARMMPGQPVPAWLFYFTVASVEAAIEATHANGGKIVMGPHDVPGGGRIAIGIDPQGAAFAVYAQVG